MYKVTTMFTIGDIIGCKYVDTSVRWYKITKVCPKTIKYKRVYTKKGPLNKYGYPVNLPTDRLVDRHSVQNAKIKDGYAGNYIDRVIVKYEGDYDQWEEKYNRLCSEYSFPSSTSSIPLATIN